MGSWLSLSSMIMSRFCSVSKKKPLSGHSVSHANNKTKRRFLPNLQQFSFYSETLNRSLSFRLSVRGSKTVETKGGLDGYVLATKPQDLCKEMRSLRSIILKRQAIKS